MHTKGNATRLIYHTAHCSPAQCAENGGDGIVQLILAACFLYLLPLWWFLRSLARRGTGKKTPGTTV
jgi:hypothetical protein